jgi:hypothetical protein
MVLHRIRETKYPIGFVPLHPPYRLPTHAILLPVDPDTLDGSEQQADEGKTMPAIPYLLIQAVSPTTHMRVLKLARARGKSVSETARDLLSHQLSLDSWMTPDRSKVAAARKAKIKVRRI